MIDIGISLDEFPIGQEQDEVRGQWLPVYLEPVAGSGERFTIGIAVVGDSGFSVVAAGKLSRFHCLYDARGGGVVFMALAALDCLREDIAARGLEALTEPRPPMSGIHFGELRQGAGASLEAIATSWLAGMSSFASEPEGHTADVMDDGLSIMDSDAPGRDQLARQVASLVIAKRPGFAGFFRRDIRPAAGKRRKHILPVVRIDFQGSRLAANFRTINGKSPFKSIEDFKRPLWDLNQERIMAGPLEQADKHYELIVRTQSQDDPNYSRMQLKHISEALAEIEQQAGRDNVRVVRHHSIFTIEEHIVMTETAVGAPSAY